jgi:vanillate/3-O-methylgallate O-demethylase
VSAQSLQSLLQAQPDVVGLLRNSKVGAYVYPVVPSEFSNWRLEQQGWRETAVLFDQTHHMAEITVRGPDALKMLSYLTINSFVGFTVDKAKQMVPLSHDGYVIGDGILFYMAHEEFLFVGRTPTVNWIEFHARTGGYNLEVIRDDRSPSNPKGQAVNRRHYRFQIQGPNAWKIIEKLHGSAPPDVKFFTMSQINIAGRMVRCLRHGMAGAPGLEIWGPYGEREEIRAAIVAAGAEFGLREVGARAYSSNTLESGWIPSPLPAVYTGEAMRSYREWLPANGYEGTASVGGSFVSNNIEDYYLTPHALGYGPFIKYDHDFVGRAALERRQGQSERKKVTFAWNPSDVLKIFASLLEPGGENYKYFDFPNCNYATSSYDNITSNGRTVGYSMFGGYSFNERTVLSLGVVDQGIEVGDELTLVWGEESGGTGKTTVERHRQLEIRVRVSPTPYAVDARAAYYGSGWRSTVA